MQNIDNNELKLFLENKYNYKNNQSDKVVDKLLAMREDIFHSFNNWYQTGSFSTEPRISGFDPKSLSESLPLKPPAIFLLLDWISREPDEAIEALNKKFGNKKTWVVDEG